MTYLRGVRGSSTYVVAIGKLSASILMLHARSRAEVDLGWTPSST